VQSEFSVASFGLLPKHILFQADQIFLQQHNTEIRMKVWKFLLRSAVMTDNINVTSVNL
jgi:hypothetical protein